MNDSRMKKVRIIGKSILWALEITLFPVLSGTLSVILKLDTVHTLFLQSLFMLMALIHPLVLVFLKKWNLSDIGFKKMNRENIRAIGYFLPLLAIFIPVAIRGFSFVSAGYVLGNFCLYLLVGISEEIYFRGIIPKYLERAFLKKGIIVISTLIFAVGHIAIAFSGSSIAEIILTVLNAFIFGWMAIEVVMLSGSIIPMILIHFFFDFETKIAAISNEQLLVAEGTRGTIMFLICVWLGVILYKEKEIAKS